MNYIFYLTIKFKRYELCVCLSYHFFQSSLNTLGGESHKSTISLKISTSMLERSRKTFVNYFFHFIVFLRLLLYVYNTFIQILMKVLFLITQQTNQSLELRSISNFFQKDPIQVYIFPVRRQPSFNGYFNFLRSKLERGDTQDRTNNYKVGLSLRSCLSFILDN